MANVKICDRCGKEIPKNGYRERLTYKHTYSVWIDIENAYADYDLCDRCNKDFKEFMKGPSCGDTEDT